MKLSRRRWLLPATTLVAAGDLWLLTGRLVGIVSANYLTHDTFYVVLHVPTGVAAAVVIALCGLFYEAVRTAPGALFRLWLACAQFALTAIGVVLQLAPAALDGLEPPSRFVEHARNAQTTGHLFQLGYVCLALSLVPYLAGMLSAVVSGIRERIPSGRDAEHPGPEG